MNIRLGNWGSIWQKSMQSSGLQVKIVWRKYSRKHTSNQIVQVRNQQVTYISTVEGTIAACLSPPLATINHQPSLRVCVISIFVGALITQNPQSTFDKKPGHAGRGAGAWRKRTCGVRPNGWFNRIGSVKSTTLSRTCHFLKKSYLNTWPIPNLPIFGLTTWSQTVWSPRSYGPLSTELLGLSDLRNFWLRFCSLGRKVHSWDVWNLKDHGKKIAHNRRCIYKKKYIYI